MIDVGFFLSSNVRPNLSEVDISGLDYKTISEIRRMTETQVTSGKFAITCDNPVWVAQSTNDKGEISYFSNDGSDNIYMATGKRKSFLRYGLSNEKLGLLHTEYIKFIDAEDAIDLTKQNKTNNEEETNSMATNELDDIMKMVDEEVTEGIKPMSNFEETGAKGARKQADPEAKEKKQAEKEKAEARKKKIRDDVAAARGNSNIDMSVIEASWKKYSELICFITPTDKRQSIAAVKVPVKAAQRELLDTAPNDVKTNFLQNPNGVPSEWIKVSYEIKARESKPGKAVGVIARIPAYLKDLSISDYIKSIAIEEAKKALSTDNSATAIELNTMADFEQKLTFAGSSITEAKETAPIDGKPGEIKILIGQPSSNASSKSNVLKDQGMLLSKKIVKTGQGNKTPMHDRNYFPLTTYETVDITKNIPEDVVADLNKYTFESLFTPAKNSKQVGTKHANLINDNKIHITKNGDVIESDYITNGANRIDLTVTAFYDKNQGRTTIELPVKKRTPKPDGTLGAPQFVKYNVTLEDKMADPDYRMKSSLGRPEFAHIVELVGADNLTPAVLKEKFKRTSGGTSVSKYLNAEIARDLLIIKMGGGLGNYSISGLNLE